ncbi:hypothetical protein Pint_15996 [Pistacia integerrima]|uniref:Uncharacterized protein n=1 Tax=Pistacia integerrima TaxID=434235 RepID=A0ACC0ZDM6_9ROSI|nr:hypothetical protein Pint_15996 [Pistacia integerrima]
MAMEGHARMLEQYADLEEKHIQLLARHIKIHRKREREKERRCLRDENKGFQAQLRDTAEAIQAIGEALVLLKEAEEVVAAT